MAEPLECPAIEPAASLHGKVEAVIGQHREQAAGPARLHRDAGNFTKNAEPVDDPGRQHGAFLERNDLVRTAAMEAEDDAARALHDREDGAPPTAEADRYDRLDLRRNAALPEGGGDEVAFPGEVGGALPVLDGAGTAPAEMAADRRNSFRAWLDQTGETGAAAPSFDLDGFAGQRQGHEDAAGWRLGDAVAGMADTGARHRLSHAGRRAGTRDCPCRLRSAIRTRARRASGGARRARRRRPRPPAGQRRDRGRRRACPGPPARPRIAA